MLIIYKAIGLTPLQAIFKLKEKMPELSSSKLSYAGRLDPMAEGLLLILVDEENKKRREYEHFEKSYEFEVLLGFRSDTYDLLGLAEIKKAEKRISRIEINKFISKNTGEIIQQYPPYSSIKVKGKSLYWWARQNKKVKAPKKKINIIKLELIDRCLMEKKELESIVSSRINRVEGDFRQVEILKNWRRIFEEIDNSYQFQVLKFSFSCSSGGYVRALVNDLGKDLGVGAITLSIKRTRIGDMDLDSAIYL